MATNDQVSQEYILIKCFLYKYTPEFTAAEGVTSSLSTFSPYSIDLDNTKFFTKYDISQFVTSYTFNQKIDETTYSWSVELQDLALSYSTINTKLKVQPTAGNSMRGGLSFQASSNSGLLLAEYETNANTIENNNNTITVPVPSSTNPTATTELNSTSNFLNTTNPILAAKQRRGASPGPLTAQNVNINTVQSTVPGVRLSDLIQEYDFISVYLYKNTTPLTSIWGVFTVDDSIDNNPIQIFNYKVTSDTTPPFHSYQNPLDPYLQQESVLLTKMPTGQTLFSNEFNGYVIKKATTSSINQVDKISISGNGWTRLFGSTRRLMKPSLFQNSLYQAGQVLGASDVSAFENVYAGRSISYIIRDLFDLVYKIDFNTSINSVVTGFKTPINSNNTTNLASSTQKQGDFFASPLSLSGSTTPASLLTAQTSQQLILENSFFNITSLVVANTYPANLFNLPQYLLASVMKFRPFAFIEPINYPVDPDFVQAVKAEAASQTVNALAPGQAQTTGNIALETNFASIQVSSEAFQTATQNTDTASQVINYGGINPVFVDPTLQNMVAYFQFLSDVFQKFNPDLQTPYEILDVIRNQAFAEIYEQPNGQFIVRAPQYNNFATSVTGRSDIGMIRSSNLNIVTSSYLETVESLVTKLFVSYSPNVTPLATLQQFGYCDGKLLVQNGLLEATSAANPNAATASLTNSSTTSSQTTGIFGYAEYLMELMNARLKTGAIMADLDNTVQVGQTYLDETKYKFGYIVGVTKQVSVSGTATMTLELSYVRDAVPTYSNTNAIVNINVDLLPTLEDIQASFAPGS